MHVTINELITTIYRTPSLSMLYFSFVAFAFAAVLANKRCV